MKIGAAHGKTKIANGASKMVDAEAVGCWASFVSPTYSLALLLAGTVAVSAFAAPAPWYKWRSKLTGQEICAQVMQGEWEMVAGPFRDAQCRKPGMPG